VLKSTAILFINHIENKASSDCHIKSGATSLADSVMQYFFYFFFPGDRFCSLGGGRGSEKVEGNEGSREKRTGLRHIELAKDVFIFVSRKTKK